MILCGLDEAGRGSIAGPLVLAAVTFSEHFRFEDVAQGIAIRDSKKLSVLQRYSVFRLIQKHALKIDTEELCVDDINKGGTHWANIEGFRRLILRNNADRYIVDGRWYVDGLKDKEQKTTSILDADETIPCVLAAGIVAKTEYDNILNRLHSEYPVYGWSSNTGHATSKHMRAISLNGLCSHHRLIASKTALGTYEKKYGKNS